MAALSPAEYARHLANARRDGIRVALSRTDPTHYQATSSQPGQPGYAVKLDPTADAGTCTCRAGLNGTGCKHLASAIAARSLAQASAAARALHRRRALLAAERAYSDQSNPMLSLVRANSPNLSRAA